jgi:UDP-N-acetylglucosamine 4-epimerase
MLAAARDAVNRFVSAASTKVDDTIGEPYAVTKICQRARVRRTYGFESIGLRYFSVRGPRQDLNGASAAVIPIMDRALIKG